MGIEENKRIARDFLARFTASDVDGALAGLTDDATWWIAGKPGQPGSGRRQGADRALSRYVGPAEDGSGMTVTSAIAEGDRRSCRAASCATGVYEQVTCW